MKWQTVLLFALAGFVAAQQYTIQKMQRSIAWHQQILKIVSPDDISNYIRQTENKENGK